MSKAQEVVLLKRLLEAGPALLRDLADLAEDYQQAVEDQDDGALVEILEEARLCLARAEEDVAVGEVSL